MKPTTKQRREAICLTVEENNLPKETIHLSPVEYNQAIVGYIEDAEGCHLCYNKATLLKIMGKIHGWNEEDCLEWYNYNTVRSLPYFKSSGVIPVILETV